MEVKLDPKNNKQESLELLVEHKVYQGVVSRAASMTIVMSVLLFFYSFTSLVFIRAVDTSITLWDNFWPRLIFNVIPALCFYMYIKDYKKNVHFKAWLWTIFNPILFASCCMIHVWPLIYNGHFDLYKMVHGANGFYVTITLLAVSLPPKMLAMQVFMISLVIIAPIAFMVKSDSILLRLVIGDFGLTLLGASIISYSIYRLRLKIATFDVKVQAESESFLGSQLSEAIRSNKLDELNNSVFNCLVIFTDLRGYTKLYKEEKIEIVESFMEDYKKSLIRIFSSEGAYCQKSVGDGYYIYFGLFDDVDLSDIPLDKNDNELAKRNIIKDRFQRAKRSIEKLNIELVSLQEKYFITSNVQLCASICSGPIKIKLYGDKLFKRELEVEGVDIIRATRLESYTKFIRKIKNISEPILIVAPELEECVSNDYDAEVININDKYHPIDDFPEIKKVFIYNLKSKMSNAA